MIQKSINHLPKKANAYISLFQPICIDKE